MTMTRTRPSFYAQQIPKSSSNTQCPQQRSTKARQPHAHTTPLALGHKTLSIMLNIVTHICSPRQKWNDVKKSWVFLRWSLCRDNVRHRYDTYIPPSDKFVGLSKQPTAVHTADTEQQKETRVFYPVLFSSVEVGVDITIWKKAKNITRRWWRAKRQNKQVRTVQSVLLLGVSQDRYS